jgi:Fur family transcriptional regulator, ferric uptake regulator
MALTAKDQYRAQKEAFYDYLREKGLKRTQQRDTILQTFLKSEHHLNVDELIDLVRAIDPAIGHSTVYRTVNILLECGVAQEVRLGDDIRRIEPVRQDEHHDHLICVKCGRTMEFFDGSLEVAQILAASKQGFKPLTHTLKIYGLCPDCQDVGFEGAP